MRKSMRLMVICGEVLLFGLLAACVARGEEWREARPVRVAVTNSRGEVSTLEYRRPVKVVADEWRDDGLVPLDSLPLVSIDARATEYPARQANYTPQTTVRYAGQPALPLVQAADCRPALVNYPPATQYQMPSYAAPVTGVPQTVYYPQQPLIAPPPAANVQVGAGIYGQPVIYRPGQPVRNVWRWLTP